MPLDVAFGADPPKKRRTRKSKSAPDGDITIIIGDDDAPAPFANPATGALTFLNPDGSAVVDFAPPRDTKLESKHDDNLAEIIDQIELSRICEELLEGIAADDQSRQDWLTQRARGIDLLALKLDEPKSVSGVGGNISSVRHPLLLEACLNFQANARGELAPSHGPVKIASEDVIEGDKLAGWLEQDLNYFLTKTATEFVPDLDQMLFMLGFGGSSFRKAYYCPMKRRPVILTVDAADLIASDYATDLASCARVTHVVEMKPSDVRRRQLEGIYLDIDLGQSVLAPNAVNQKIALSRGIRPNDRPQDINHTLYECYCELDIKGFEHRTRKGKGKKTGIPLPYRVTIDVTSRQILEIRRRWREKDWDYKPRKTWIGYTFVPGMQRLLGIGLLNILGNSTSALTAAWRLMLDNGMFANFPGFLYAKSTGRQMTHEMRVPPGAGLAIDLAGTQDINKAVMPLPYKETGQSLMMLVESIASNARNAAGAAQVQIAEGKQEAPVGTTLALIEQAVKIMSSVHKRLHASQAEELEVLKELFMEHPEALLRSSKRAKRHWKTPEALVEALELFDLAPYADPNTPSHMHRVMKATAIKQLSMSSPGVYDVRAVDAYVLNIIGVENPERLFAPPQPPAGPDPISMRAMDLKEKDLALKGQTEVAKLADKEKDRASKERLQLLEIAERLATHPESLGVVQSVMGTSRPS